jgi:hypothetical protein
MWCTGKGEATPCRRDVDDGEHIEIALAERISEYGSNELG